MLDYREAASVNLEAVFMDQPFPMYDQSTNRCTTAA